VQAWLREHRIDGWLLWDFRGQNPTAIAALGLCGTLLTRRLAYLVPADGEPTLLAHRVEVQGMPPLLGRIVPYGGYREFHERLGELLRGRQRVAMEYCPMGTLPALSRVDAGTLELVRSFGVEVVPSADLVTHFLARLSAEQIESHRRAAIAIDRLKEEAFRWIASRVRAGRPALETEVQRFLSEGFARAGLVTDHPPIVAVDAHSANPHHVPSPQTAKPCAEGSLVLIDLWAKEDAAEAVYADITWVAWIGGAPPSRVVEVFETVREARDLGVRLLEETARRGERIEGWKVDRAVRDFVTSRGHGEAFVHRTGHNIGADSVHGDGPNLDDLETHDTRQLVPGLCFSIEPGIYLEGFGIRSEIDVVLEAEGPRVFTPPQRELVRLP
jgi:Xaa-Pro aminopeptidase